MLKKIFSKFFGKFENREEVKKYALLGIIFGLLIATYWGLRPLKDGIFFGIVGADYQPIAKYFSLAIILVFVTIYGKLIDKISRDKIFYLLVALYAIGAFIFSFLLSNPTVGIPNTVESPTRILGWAWYIFVESIGTMFVPLFWAFAADVSTKDSARRGFPFIALCAQFGNIVGPWFLRATRLGFKNSAPIVAIAGLLLIGVGILVWIFMLVTPKSEFHMVNQTPPDEKPGFFEGLKLLTTKGYLMGIFIFMLAFETINTVIEYYFKLKVKAQFPDELLRSNYLATFAVITGLLSFFCLLFGVSNIQRKLGMRASLITLPFIMIGGITIWWFIPTLLVSGIVVVIFKGLNYSINQPSVKQLYIPTSEDTRYKAQAWIEVFGSRGSKTIGSMINNLKLPLTNYLGATTGLTVFLSIASLTSFSLLALWIFIAFFVSAQYNKAIKDDTLVC
jgi:ATP:ADP antiporter, AAA family